MLTIPVNSRTRAVATAVIAVVRPPQPHANEGQHRVTDRRADEEQRPEQAIALHLSKLA